MKRHIISILVTEHAVKAPDHEYELLDALQGARFKTKHLGILQHLPHADIIFICCEDGAVHRSFSDTTDRIINDALQRLFIPGIDNDPQVSDIILDLLSLVKRYAAVDGVWNIHPSQAFL